jgi:flavin-dependent thymidylate synthase
MTQLRKWADEHQFVAPNIADDARTEDGEIIPKVHLLTMTPDPLGAVAAMGRMYKGLPTYSLDDITQEEREDMLEQVQKTHLKAPFEAVKLHFFIEGVTRSFTHQMVRQRTAVYAQESLRFAVKENLAQEVSVPPSVAALPNHHPTRQMWDNHVNAVAETYNYLVSNGIPAEDARGLMPHAVATRLNYVTDLRNLSDHAGNRLCTQAQFEWRIVFMGIVQAVRDFKNHPSVMLEHRWQFDALADSGLFRPICYQLGKCQFNADFDRSCTIRSRVDRFAEQGVPSHLWADADFHMGISHDEWMLDPAAARKTSGGGGHD